MSRASRLGPALRRDAMRRSPRRLRHIDRVALLLIALLVGAFATLARAQAPATTAADAPDAGGELTVSLVTFGPGDIYWERFGHNAIRVRDAARGSDVLYNYGIFDFGEDDFLLNFVRGRMHYRMDAGDTAEELPAYRAEGRWIVEQELDLDAAQKRALRDFLEWNLRPENARYRYDYFTDNCATRVRDALDKALGGAIHDQLASPSKGFTYRMHADRLMQPEGALMLGIDAGLGPFADRRLSYWDESFVPMEFMQHLRRVTRRDAGGATLPVVRREQVLAAPRLPEPPDFPADLRWPLGGIGAALAIGLLALQRVRRHAAARWLFAMLALALSLVAAAGGLVLAALWGLTEHQSAWRNANLLLFDPLCLLLLPTWWRARRADARPTRFGSALAGVVLGLAGVALALKALPWFAQANGPWVALWLPVHAALWLSLRARRDAPAAASAA